MKLACIIQIYKSMFSIKNGINSLNILYRDLHKSFPIHYCLGNFLKCILFTPVAPGAYKNRCGCNVLQVPIQKYTSGGTKAGEPSAPWWIKIVTVCLGIILRDVSQTVDNRPLIALV